MGYKDLCESTRKLWYRSVYLKSSHWRTKRFYTMRRSGGICEVCKWRKADAVHHLNYHRLWKELDTDLIVICGYCHAEEHGYEYIPKKKYKKVRKKVQRSPLYKGKK